MEEFVRVMLKSKDKYGTSAIEIDCQEYEEAVNEVLEHLEYVYQSKSFADLTLEIKGRSKTVSRSLEKVGHRSAKDGIIEFLKYAYNVKSEIPEMDSIKYESLYEDRSWLGKYDQDSLTCMEKVFLLLKHNHDTGWVKSQNLKEEYEIMYGDRIKLSAVSTYLSRLHEKGTLERKGSRAQREYRMGMPSSTKLISV